MNINSCFRLGSRDARTAAQTPAPSGARAASAARPRTAGRADPRRPAPDGNAQLGRGEGRRHRRRDRLLDRDLLHAVPQQGGVLRRAGRPRHPGDAGAQQRVLRRARARHGEPARIRRALDRARAALLRHAPRAVRGRGDRIAARSAAAGRGLAAAALSEPQPRAVRAGDGALAALAQRGRAPPIAVRASAAAGRARERRADRPRPLASARPGTAHATGGDPVGVPGSAQHIALTTRAIRKESTMNAIPAGCAHRATIDFQRLVAAEPPPADDQDFVDARRGFLGTVPDANVARRDGSPVWNLAAYGFLDQASAPDTVNPILWRQARLNREHGLFQVTERIFQVRGFDIANITFIETDHGVIALDALTCPETASTALALYRRHRGNRPLHTVIYSHSHADHFGGVSGLVSEDDVRAGRVQIIAPLLFMQCAVAENVMAGVAMARRAQFQFGHTLPVGATAQVDSGLGKNMPRGRPSLIAPTREITEKHEVHVIDGLEIEFQLTPETEAPAEMHLFVPSERALNLAENATHTLHNLCPLRGAKVRDALAWSRYLNQALHRWGDRTDVILAQHHWPTWGRERALCFLAEQRDLYRFLHDQTVRLMNHGLKATDIAEQLQLPPGLASRWHARGYYGTVSHNVKAIVQHYLSWYDAHPANLNKLPPVAAARKYVAYMGGAAAVLHKARGDFERGEFRWVAEVLAHLVHAEPNNRE